MDILLQVEGNEGGPVLFAHFFLPISKITSQSRDSIVLERWASMRKEYKNYCLKRLHLNAIYCLSKRVSVGKRTHLRQSIVRVKEYKKSLFERITP